MFVSLTAQISKYCILIEATDLYSSFLEIKVLQMKLTPPRYIPHPIPLIFPPRYIPLHEFCEHCHTYRETCSTNNRDDGKHSLVCVDVLIRILWILTHLIFITKGRYDYYFHFTDEEFEAQRG